LAMYPTMKGSRRSYAAMLTATDDAIAKIVSAVEKAGVRDNTLFIFSSDNGGPAPGRITDNGAYRGGKGKLYEGGVRVAAFATWDGQIPAGSTVTEPIHVVDWRPTLQRLCGAGPTGDHAMDGRDIWPTLTAGAPSPHDVILLNTSPQSGAVRAGDWKLIVNRPAENDRPRSTGRRGGSRGEHVQLFNLRRDPYEKNNVAEQYPEKVKSLRQKLNEFARLAVTPKGGDSKPANFNPPAVWGEAGG
jgi:arylsulfatase A-like enzyme